MDIIVRVIALYAIMLVVFRIMGKRSVSQMTVFDFVLLLIIAEPTEVAVLGDDSSFTAVVLIVLTYLAVEHVLAMVKARWGSVDRLLDGVPMIIFEDGGLIKKRAKREMVDETDIMEAARTSQGLERLDQVKYAILERNGGISVVPK